MTVINSATATAVPFTYSPSTAMPAGTSVPMDSDTILMFCQQQLQGLDDQIGQAMKTQKHAVDVQTEITGLETNVMAGHMSDGSSAFDNGQITSQAKLDDLKKQLTDKAGELSATGDPNDADTASKLNAAAQQLQEAYDDNKGSGDQSVTMDELKPIGQSLDDINTSLRSQSEMSMLDLQSLVQRRSTMLTETTNVMQGLSQPQQTITGNMKG